jgi:hypothetical protein
MTADHEFALEWIRKAEEALRIASEMFGLAKRTLGVQTG